MVLGLLRTIFGFVLACLAAGAVKVAFAVTPAELAVASPERLGQAAEWALLSATESAVFASPFAFIAIVLAEWFGVRSFAYHGLVGILIAAAGFAVLLSGQSQDTLDLANSYAIAAFLSTGLVAGIAYWLFSGRLSGGRRITRRRLEAEAARQRSSAPRVLTPAGSSVPMVVKSMAADKASAGKASEKLADKTSSKPTTGLHKPA